jgi:hypothetical protein
MANYDDHPVIQQLKQSPFYDQSGDAWDSFKQTFSVKPPEWRLESINGLDQWLAQEDKITYDHARLLTMRRELAGIHAQMRKVGR